MSDLSPSPAGRPAAKLPTALQVEITSFCNLKCKMCPLTLGATLTSVKAEHMQEAVWSEVVAAAKPIGRVILTGFGENTTNPRFVELIRELDGLGVQTSFTTNAIGMRPEIVAGLATLERLDHINVSIDSPDPEIYREIRGGKLSKAIAGLEALVAGLPPRVSITASSVVMESNLESLLAFPEILARIGVKKYILQGLHDRTETLADDDICRHPAGAATVKEIRRRCRERGITVELVAESRIELEGADPEAARRLYYEADGFGPERTRQCLSPWIYPFVDRGGRVFPCCHGDETSTMGDLAERPFEAIWDGEPFRKFRDDLIGGTDLPTICRKCVNVRVGPHPLRFGAEVDLGASRLSGRDGLRLVVRNTGAVTWTAGSPLRIGTIGDRASRLVLPGWCDPMRVAAMNEASVPSGGSATFDFALGRSEPGYSERFGLVLEGVRWFPEVEFELPDAATRSVASPAEAPSPGASVRFDAPDPRGPRPLASRTRDALRRLGAALRLGR